MLWNALLTKKKSLYIEDSESCNWKWMWNSFLQVISVQSGSQSKICRIHFSRFSGLRIFNTEFLSNKSLRRKSKANILNIYWTIIEYLKLKSGRSVCIWPSCTTSKIDLSQKGYILLLQYFVKIRISCFDFYHRIQGH